MRDVENVKPTALAKVGNSSQLIDIKDTDQTRVLCILLTLNAVVSYRSVPRILELFKSKTNYSVGWVPHFTSVINWSLRLGLGLLTQVQVVITQSNQSLVTLNNGDGEIRAFGVRRTGSISRRNTLPVPGSVTGLVTR